MGLKDSGTKVTANLFMGLYIIQENPTYSSLMCGTPSDLEKKKSGGG